MANLGKKLPFPKTQAQMEAYQKKKKAGTYTFTKKAWYEVAPVVPVTKKTGEGFGKITGPKGETYYPPTARKKKEPSAGGAPEGFGKIIGPKGETYHPPTARKKLLPTDIPTGTGGALPFPTTQAQMAEYQKKYVLEDRGEGRKWYVKRTTTIDKKKGIQKQVDIVQKQIVEKQAALEKQQKKEALEKQVAEKQKQITEKKTALAKELQRQIDEKQAIIDEAAAQGVSETEEIPASVYEAVGISPPEDVAVTSETEREKEDEEEKEKEEKTQEELDEIETLTRQQQLKTLRTEAGLDPETGEKLEKPALPTFATDFEALRDEQGMSALESQINNLNSQIADAEASLRLGLYDEEGKLRPMELIGARQQELARQGREALDALLRRKQVLVDEYNTKLNVVNATMGFKQLDYEAAVDEYNTSFNQNIQLINMVDKRETQELQEENQQRDDARANLNVMLSAFTASGKTMADLTPELLTQIDQLALKADIPADAIKELMLIKPNEKVIYSGKSTDESGKEFITFITQAKDGTLTTEKLYTGGVEEEKAKTYAPSLKQTEDGEWAWFYPDGRVVKTGEKGKVDTSKQQAIKDMAVQLDLVRGDDGYISPENYKKARNAWVKEGGLTADDFDKAFAKIYVNPSHPEDYGVSPSLFLD